MNATIYFEFVHGRFIEMGSAPGAEIVASLLGDDIQYGQESMDLYSQFFAESEMGGGRQNNGFANANWIASNRTHVFIQSSAWKFDCVLMTQAQARDVLQKYQYFRNHGRRDINNPPEPCEIEYEAEGEEAFRLADLLELAFVDAEDD